MVLRFPGPGNAGWECERAGVVIATNGDKVEMTFSSATPMSKVSRDVVIVNSQGMHARPAMVFSETANRFKAAIKVAKPTFAENGTEVDGKSLIQMISLEATAGATLRIRAEGDDADAAVDELARLIESGFGED